MQQRDLVLPERVPAITVRQPWAEMIARGKKTIECSRDLWAYRGPLVIHAGRAAPYEDELEELGVSSSEQEKLVYGGTLALVMLVDARLPRPGDAKNALCDPGKAPLLVLENAMRLEPRAVRGHPGMFFVKRDVVVLA
jgi:hypothetical protein